MKHFDFTSHVPQMRDYYHHSVETNNELLICDAPLGLGWTNYCRLRSAVGSPQLGMAVLGSTLVGRNSQPRLRGWRGVGHPNSSAPPNPRIHALFGTVGENSSPLPGKGLRVGGGELPLRTRLSTFSVWGLGVTSKQRCAQPLMTWSWGLGAGPQTPNRFATPLKLQPGLGPLNPGCPPPSPGWTVWQGLGNFSKSRYFLPHILKAST